MCVLIGFLCVWNQILAVISCRVRNRMLDTIVFRQSHVVFFTFFSSASFFDIISSKSPQVLAKYF